MMKEKIFNPAKQILRGALMLIIMLAVAACVGEEPDPGPDPGPGPGPDPSKKPAMLVLNFQLDGTPQGISFGDEVKKVEVFIFNNASPTAPKLLSRHVVDNAATFSREMPAGKYRIVCWGNIANFTNINAPNAVTFADAHLGAKLSNEAEGIASGYDPLFYGPAGDGKFKELAFEVTDAHLDQTITHTVNFMSGHVAVAVDIKLPAPSTPLRAEGDAPIVELRNIPRYYDFNGNLFGDLITFRVPSEPDGEGGYKATFFAPIYSNQPDPDPDPEPGTPPPPPTPTLAIIHGDRQLSANDIGDALKPPTGGTGGGLPNLNIEASFIQSSITLQLPNWEVMVFTADGELVTFEEGDGN